MDQWVVLIDDDDEEAVLLQHGFSYSTAAVKLSWCPTPQTFYELRRQNDNKPSVILLDLNLTGLEGIQWIPTFIQHPCSQGIPVVIYSGSDSKEQRRVCLESGVAGYLVKPSSQTAMKALVSAVETYWPVS